MSSKYLKEDGHVGCEDDNKCCKCVPIKLGMQILTVLYAVDATGMFLIAIDTPVYYWSLGLLLLGNAIFTYGTLRMLMWLLEDTQEHRDYLPDAFVW